MCRWRILLKWAEEIHVNHRAFYRDQYRGFIQTVLRKTSYLVNFMLFVTNIFWLKYGLVLFTRREILWLLKRLLCSLTSWIAKRKIWTDCSFDTG